MHIHIHTYKKLHIGVTLIGAKIHLTFIKKQLLNKFNTNHIICSYTQSCCVYLNITTFKIYKLQNNMQLLDTQIIGILTLYNKRERHDGREAKQYASQ